MHRPSHICSIKALFCTFQAVSRAETVHLCAIFTVFSFNRPEPPPVQKQRQRMLQC